MISAGPVLKWTGPELNGPVFREAIHIPAGSYFAAICNAREITESCFHTLRIFTCVAGLWICINDHGNSKTKLGQNVPPVLLMFSFYLI